MPKKKIRTDFTVSANKALTSADKIIKLRWLWLREVRIY